ncbi:hypothetical protein Mycch_4352 [Mycolicibacterium chubuense NBB4]|uniref:Sulfur globule protein n=1 Tax=Mycolicibacterium chubuense (strain NBB4) TaxID=710421 RepID=I4BP55_MYCCN|nr:hypothetical protein [Mycolicibacterium chubuense]AFM19062.1 hypothetical protein Mycch_4352 [Mycolicibacterium chubuense NBB4]
MKKFGLVGIVAGALSAAVIGFAGPAQADGNGFGFGGYGYGHNGYGYGYGPDHSYPWINQLFPHVNVPHVDTTAHQ